MESQALQDLVAEQEAPSRALIEREAPLALISRALSEACEGRGSVVAVEGAHGLGKSSLVSVARTLAADDGLEVLSAQGRELEQDFTFGVLLQLFESRIAAASEEERGRLLSGAARMAVPLFAPGPRQVPDEHSFSILHGLYWLCVNLAAQLPLLLTVDDVDLADATSLRFLLYLTERVQELPIAVVVAHGSALRCPDPDVLWQTTRHPAATGCRLHPLSVQGTARLMRTSLYPQAETDFCRAVHDATGGNPLLLHDLLPQLAGAGIEPVRVSAPEVAAFAPPGLGAAVTARIRPLGEDTEKLVLAAAVLGPGTEVRHAAVLAGLDLTAAAAAADALMAAGVLARDERLTFVHPIVMRALNAEQPPARWAEVHLRAARILAEEEAAPEVIAAHLMNSTRSGSGWAVDALCAAAEDALERGAPAAAVNYLRRALQEPPVRDRRAHVVLQLGRAEATAGNPQAVDRLSEAIERLPDPLDRARTALETGRMLFSLGRLDDAAGAFRRGIDELPREDEGLGELLRAALGTVSRLETARAGLPAAPSVAPKGNDTPGKRAQLAQLALEGALRGDARDEVLELATRALARGALLDDTTADGISYYVAASALTVAEDLQTAEAALTAAVEEARSRGSVLGMATSSYFRSLAIQRRGRVGDASADARAALAAERHGWRLAGAGARAVLADTLVELGDLQAAERLIEESEAHAEEEGEASATRTAFLAARGRLRLLRGEGEEALADFTSAGDYLLALGITNPALSAWRSGAARAHALVGDRDEAVRLAEEELDLARRFGAPGTVGHSLRALAAVQGGPAALELLEEAVRQSEQSQAALERARALIDYGSALRRAGRRRDAREPLRLGLDLAQRCGAAELAGRAMRETTAAGARPRRTAMEGLEALTARERQVAGLAAQGMSNREIAEALFVTVKTVEWHLKHTYAKLGVSSRRELRGAMTDAAQ
ncbi:MAG TPA: LuxR C-terminal-related transcriptional regulator [Thermoleophilaceae bacterium]